MTGYQLEIDYGYDPTLGYGSRSGMPAGYSRQRLQQ